MADKSMHQTVRLPDNSVVTKALVPETEAKTEAPGFEAKTEAPGFEAKTEAEAVASEAKTEAVDPETKAARQLIGIGYSVPINVKYR